MATTVLENKTGSSAHAVPKGLTPWKPGQSGNPSGRALGLTKQAQAITKDGKELVEFFYKLFKDEKEKMDRRIQAAEWLADRGWGKAVTVVDDKDGGQKRFIFVSEKSLDEIVSHAN